MTPGDMRALASDPAAAAADRRRPRGSRWSGWLAFDRVGALYIWAAIIVIFAVWVPETFPTAQTAKNIVNQNAITGLVALSLVIPLAAGVFDLSVAYTMGFAAVFLAWILGNTGIPVAGAIVLTLAAAALIGLVNGTVIVRLGIDSFIATLATGSLLQAGILLVTGDETLTENLTGSFNQIARANVGGVTAPVAYMLIVAVVLWYVLEHRPIGRWLYATGFNQDATRLAGIPTDRLRFLSLVISAEIAAVAGIAVTASIGAGSPTVGPPYLLPAFAAAFVGATQFHGGRFNAWGTIVAVLLLGTGTAGLSLAGAPLWSSNVFTGVALILALAVTRVQRRPVASWRRRRRTRPSETNKEGVPGCRSTCT